MAWEPPARFDEYEIVKPLGRGTSGHVYLARDTLLERDVAVKLIVSLEPAQLAQFLVEARAAARIQHPNVATLYRVGQSADFAYLVWELVRGQSLDRVARPVTPDDAMRIGRDVARGLAASHRRGVLHRDIKPGNIVLTDAGEAKLVDFGLAALMASEESQRTGELVGTPYFRAPETWQGEPADVRSDLYSFGVVLYELLAGRPPFTGPTSMHVLVAIVGQDPSPV